MRYGMVIDLTTCMGCHTCAVACKQANNLPNGIWWNRVYTDGGEAMDTARGTYPNDLHRTYYPVSCQHCSKPACVDVCPTGASYIREDGFVAVNADECIGCASCTTACPYGVRTLHGDNLEYSVGFPVGDPDAPVHVAATVSKCTGCANRISRDAVPACMDLCPGRARFWGDFDDPESEVSKLIATREYERLLEDAGTEPNVYYLK